MLNRIMKAVGLAGAAPEEAQKEALSTELLAAVLLMEAAHADYECSEAEQEHVVETIRSMYDLPEQYVAELLELAHSHRDEAVDIQHFTNLINKRMDRAQKLELLEAVCRLIMADGHLDKYEDYFARKLTHLLWLNHPDFVEAKLRAQGK